MIKCYSCPTEWNESEIDAEVAKGFTYCPNCGDIESLYNPGEFENAC